MLACGVVCTGQVIGPRFEGGTVNREAKTSEHPNAREHLGLASDTRFHMK